VQDNKGQWQDVTDINDGQGLADGGLISTVGDMAIFIRALINGEVISDSSWKEMTSYVDDRFGEGYGLGIGTYTTAYGTGIGHDGTSSGYASELWYWPDYDLVIAILYGSEDLQADLSETLIDAALGYVTQ
jgi:D-alanyl-D-alanine carboxypeptidase